MIGQHDAAQAQALIRALTDPRDKAISQVKWFESQGSQQDAVALRRDVSEAQAHITNLQRRYLDQEPAQPQRTQHAHVAGPLVLPPGIAMHGDGDLVPDRRRGNRAARTGITSVANALVSVLVLLTAATIRAGAARADPSQQDQFVALLEQEQIPPIDNLPALVDQAHQICGELAGGASVKTVVIQEMNGMVADDPRLNRYPNRVRRTAVRFVTASVDVYCPNHRQ
jgi:hypothetical protein